MNANKRPTPETKAATLDGYTFCKEDLRPAIAFCENLERERDEARERIAELEKQLAELQKPKEPETFEAHGLTWIKHIQGNPMPCDGETEVRVLYSREKKGVYRDYTNQANFWSWSDSLSEGCQIIGWNYADAL